MRTLLTLLISFVLLPAQAQDANITTSGSVTVNGRLVPPGSYQTFHNSEYSPPIKGPTLAQALSTTKSAALCLTVSAERVPLAPQMSLPAPSASPVSLTQAFGRITRRFGSITAIAPPTMTVFYTPSGSPDIYANLQQDQVLQLLAASLTPAQWSLLTGLQGIGLSDLTTDDQRGLFHALFPGKRLEVHKGWNDKPDPATGQFPDYAAELPQARIRLAQRYSMGISSSRKAHSWVGGSSGDTDSEYRIANTGPASPEESSFGQPTHDTQPNTPKRGQLDFHLPALQAAVPLQDVPTVGELFVRVRKATGLEVYADSRYEAKTLTLTRPGQATAAELLQAVAFCLTGTYRQIGPAFVLTDDVLGSHIRRLLWAQWQAKAMSLQGKPVKDAQEKIAAAHSIGELSTGGYAIAVQPEQYAMEDKVDHTNWRDGRGHIVLTFDHLTPAQQAAAKAMMPGLANSRSNGQPPSLDGTIHITSSPQLQLLLPSLDKPVTLGYSIEFLFLSNEPRNSPVPVRPKPPVQPLTATLSMIPRRAVLLAPQTPAQVSALLPILHQYGFNQLWLRVFYRGKTSDLAVLTRALMEGPKLGIAVFADIDALRWGADAPPEMQDITPLGPITQQANATLDEGRAALAAPPFVWAAINTPQIRAALLPLLRRLAQTPHLAGIVLDSPAAPGYATLSPFENSGGGYGYTLSLRLAFLRQSHTDPLDISPFEGPLESGTTAMMDWGGALSEKWSRTREQVSLAWMRELMAAAKPMTTLIRQRHADDSLLWEDWYGTWDNLKAMPPTLRNRGMMIRDGIPTQYARFQDAKPQARLAIRRYQPRSEETIQDMAEEVAPDPGQAPWDGVALDLDDAVDLSSVLTKAPGAK